MKCPGEIDSVALDNWITGHYGEDQFRDEPDWDEFLDHVFSQCIFEKLGQCKNECSDSCYVVKAFMDTFEAEQQKQHENDCPEVCCECDEDWKTCTKDPGDCEQTAWEDYAECYYEGLREMYD
jgi:hypothetical protein